ncbi:MAG TPA: ABC transporter permease subunit [Burkholderiaceae bacterium]|nr:ABC transporter permease subunit [Burkholderiaceae bacterium]
MHDPKAGARRAPPRRRLSWRSAAARGLVYQALAVVVLAALVGWLGHNTVANMRARGIQTGFGFLQQPAGFDIGESLIPYDALDPFWKAFVVGTLNTLRVALVGIVATTILGTLVGVGRFSGNALVRGLCATYVEVFRNVPVLLQLLMWYLLFTEVLPPVSEAIALGPGIWISKSGLSFPEPRWEAGHLAVLAGTLFGGLAGVGWARFARRRFERTGRPLPVAGPAVALVAVAATVAWWAGGAPSAWDVPVKGDVIVEGGATATPEYLALVLGLVIYTGAFVAEVVRAGIRAVPQGQAEAAASLGLSHGQAMRLVVLPQALRVIVPPLTSQYLNLTKNSSLAVAIGFPDVVSIANTAINQTGRAVECIAVIMAVYLTASLGTAALMGWTNRRVAIRER